MPVSLEQRQAIIAALKEGLDTQDIAARVGVSRGTVAAVKAHVTMETYKEDVEEEVEVTNAVDTAFGLERDLQSALREHIEQLEPGLTISDGGKEQTVPSGRIDITAQDRDGATVVIELKAGEADRDAVAQSLAYMGDLMVNEKSVRGILIAGDFTPRAVAAARAAGKIQLIRYGIKFSFAPV